MICLRRCERIRRRLIGESGETMVETLVSVLISALALLMLSTAIGSAVKIVLSSKAYMENYYNEERQAIDAYVSGSGASGVVTFSTPFSDSLSGDAVITINENDEGIVIYQRVP